VSGGGRGGGLKKGRREQEVSNGLPGSNWRGGRCVVANGRSDRAVKRTQGGGPSVGGVISWAYGPPRNPAGGEKEEFFE